MARGDRVDVMTSAGGPDHLVTRSEHQRGIVRRRGLYVAICGQEFSLGPDKPSRRLCLACRHAAYPASRSPRRTSRRRIPGWCRRTTPRHHTSAFIRIRRTT